MDKLTAEVETSAMRKIGWRLIPFIALLYFAAFIDRVNVGFAAAQMNTTWASRPMSTVSARGYSS